MIYTSESEDFRIFRKVSKEFSVPFALASKVLELPVERKALVVLCCEGSYFELFECLLSLAREKLKPKLKKTTKTTKTNKLVIVIGSSGVQFRE